MSLYERVVMESKAADLTEAVSCACVGWSGQYYGNTQWHTQIENDNIAALLAWRQRCPNYGTPGHASFCARCDQEVFKREVGGVEASAYPFSELDGGGPGAWPAP